MRRGFTLLEVVVALLVLEVAVVGVVSVVALASSTLDRAEELERAVAQTEGVLDSIARVWSPGRDSVGVGPAVVWWVVDDSGRIALQARGPRGDTVTTVISILPPR